MNLFSYIKTQVPILDVIGEYVTLKKAGGYYKGSCPFHSEKTASFTVSPHKEIFYCFGCHETGDVITFITKVEHSSPVEAAHHLVERYRLNIPDAIGYETKAQTQAQQDQYFALCKTVAAWCHQQLLKSPLALKYVLGRGISKACIEQFAIGYFPGGLPSMKQFTTTMRQQSILVDDLVSAAIIQEGKTVLYSPFEERIIFPIKDHLGRFCGFGGRIFKPNDTRAKYYNSKEHEFFIKGSTLFGLDAAKKKIQEQETAFIVEGYTDCIAMAQHGYTNTVATLGTACTAEHLKLLSRYAQQLYVVYDSDKAGQDAVIRLAELCWQVSIEPRVICLPPPEDPASYLGSGKSFQLMIDQAPDIFTYFINTLGKEFPTKPLAEKLTVTRKIIAAIMTIRDPLKQDLLAHKASKALDIPFQAISNELKRNQLSSKNPEPASHHYKAQTEQKKTGPIPSAEYAEGPSPLENKIFSAIMNNMNLLDEKTSDYLIQGLSQPLSSLLQKAVEQKNTQPSLDFVLFFDTLDIHQQHYVSKLLLAHDEEAMTPEACDQLIMQLQKKQWKETIAIMKNEMAIAKNNHDTQRVSALLHDFLLLKKKMLHKDLI